jgi:hypothetical protein
LRRRIAEDLVDVVTAAVDVSAADQLASFHVANKFVALSIFSVVVVIVFAI